MKELHDVTFTSKNTGFYISILEDFGWIEPVFLLISPNLKEILRLEKKPCPLLNIKHFEISDLSNNCYAIHFFNSNDIIAGNFANLKIIKADFVEEKIINSKICSLFYSSYCFKEAYDYQEYGFFFVANGISYLTNFFAFAVENY